MADQDVDILIIGGGLTGSSLMLALKDTGYRALLVESQPFSSQQQAHFDARSFALSPSTVRILQMLNLWALLAPHACPIHSIHVSERSAFGSARLKNEACLPLGYVVEMQHMNHALHQHLDLNDVIAPAKLVAFDQANGIATLTQGQGVITVKAKLIVAADGADSSVRQFCGVEAKKKDYGQQAIVANIGLSRSHQGIAYERFTSSGPLALLPMNHNRASLVWALPIDEANTVLAMNDRLFLSTLQRTFGYRLGRLTQVGRRQSFPLQQVITSKNRELPNVVFIGNAAHTLHPVGGQGLNLGLRDVAMLAQCIVQKGFNQTMLMAYHQERSRDQKNIIQLTDGLIQLFGSQLPGMAFARRTGIVVLDQIAIFKRILIRYTSGFSGITPDLVCNIPLHKDNPA